MNKITVKREYQCADTGFIGDILEHPAYNSIAIRSGTVYSMVGDFALSSTGYPLNVPTTAIDLNRLNLSDFCSSISPC